MIIFINFSVNKSDEIDPFNSIDPFVPNDFAPFNENSESDPFRMSGGFAVKQSTSDDPFVDDAFKSSDPFAQSEQENIFETSDPFATPRNINDDDPFKEKSVFSAEDDAFNTNDPFANTPDPFAGSDDLFKGSTTSLSSRGQQGSKSSLNKIIDNKSSLRSSKNSLVGSKTSLNDNAQSDVISEDSSNVYSSAKELSTTNANTEQIAPDPFASSKGISDNKDDAFPAQPNPFEGSNSNKGFDDDPFGNDPNDPFADKSVFTADFGENDPFKSKNDPFSADSFR